MITTDYITVETWNTKLQKVEYHYVHKSIKNPKQYVLSLHPEQILLWLDRKELRIEDKHHILFIQFGEEWEIDAIERITFITNIMEGEVYLYVMNGMMIFFNLYQIWEINLHHTIS